MLRVPAYPDLDLVAFITTFAAPLGELETPAGLAGLLRSDAAAPVQASEALRVAVRTMLKARGFKATGRNKPASEYLVRAAEGGPLRSINVAVDAGNAVSLHSGIPISVVDLDRLQGPLAVDVAAPGARYVFNPAGQEIDVGQLLCLIDAAGPCANAVKDAQRSKTDGTTRRTLSLLWGCGAVPGATAAAARWYLQLLTELGARTELWAGATA
jgi:DNA/RNA-binding domain of Phe-tRNA-synthetase-like protein